MTKNIPLYLYIPLSLLSISYLLFVSFLLYQSSANAQLTPNSNVQVEYIIDQNASSTLGSVYKIIDDNFGIPTVCYVKISTGIFCIKL